MESFGWKSGAYNPTTAPIASVGGNYAPGQVRALAFTPENRERASADGLSLVYNVCSAHSVFTSASSINFGKSG